MKILKRLKQSFKSLKESEEAQKIEDEITLKATLKELIDEGSEDDTSLNIEERLILRNALRLSELEIKAIMTPRADITWIPENITFDELRELIAKFPYNRYPVCRSELDDVIGKVHLKDLIKFLTTSEEFSLPPLVQKVLYVVPSMRCLDLFTQMKTTAIHLAVVVDEFGGVDGIVTIHDLIGEVIGVLDDDWSDDVPSYTILSDGAISLEGRFLVEDFETQFGDFLTKEEKELDQETMAGVVSAIAGRLPAKGEVISHSSGIRFEVTDVDARRIRKLKVYNTKKQQGPS